MRRPADQTIRDLACHDLGTTYLIEAGAGTGKTRILVERFVACLIEGGCDVRRVAAITFTEKAAGELRQRVRGRLLELSGDASRESGARERTVAALADLDQAPISTIHAFAARLLRERPVDAGMDPAFEQLDALGASLLFEELWQAWLDEVSGVVRGGEEGSPADGTRRLMAEALTAGVRLDQLAAVARSAYALRYGVEAPPQPPQPPSLDGPLAAVRQLAPELRRFSESACLRTDDNGYRKALALCGALEPLRTAADIHEVGAVLGRALSTLSEKRDPGGNKANWAAGAKAEMVARYRDLANAADAAFAPYGAYVAGLTLAITWRFVAAAARQQLARGLADFDDLLGKLRDALRDKSLRRYYQAEFDHILVDEFQDTDPLQVEALLFLAEDGAVADEWRQVILKKGKLFLVGDPKQSIYRFRRADIGIYDEVKRLLQDGQGCVRPISVNFRCAPSVIEWVNESFTSVIGDDAGVGRQPEYVPLEPYRGVPEAGEPRVHVVCGAQPEGRESAESRRRREAAEFARLVGAEIVGRWQVRDESGGGWRPAGFGDVAVLLRSFTGVGFFERALAGAGIPFRTEGGSAYYQRREVRDALGALRAVDNPADAPAVYAALHGTFFGFTDERLFLYAAADGAFDYLEACAPADDELAAALAVLRDVHLRRHELGIAGALEQLLAGCHVLEGWAAAGEGGAQAVANLRKLMDKARAFDAQPGSTLHGFLAYAERAATAAAEAESIPGEGDAVVRLMTVHAAKGLEFPVVVIADGGGQGGGGGREVAQVLADRGGKRLECRFKVWTAGTADGVPPVETSVESDGFGALRALEDAMDDSERRRIFYVAATRACDHLVVMRFGKAGSGSLLGPLDARLPQPGQVTERAVAGAAVWRPAGGPAPSVRPAGLPPDAAAAVLLRETWLREREALLASASRPAPITSPSVLEEVERPADDEGRPLPHGRAVALAVGGAVHRVMELTPLDRADVLPDLAARCAAEQDVAEQACRVLDLARACWAAAPVRAAASGAHWRELPVSFADAEGRLVEGFVDLLYEAPEGYVVVDYKTDAAATDDVLRRRYRLQGGAYALAVEAATGRPVAAVAFVRAAHPGGDGAADVVEIPVDERLRADTRTALAAAAAVGLPLDEHLASGCRPL